MSLLDDYHQAVDYLENNFGKNKKDSNFFINRTKYFLDLLGNPETGFRYIHVTGTAGKGTVSTMIQETLTASGKKAGLFTSPHASTSIEKIRVQDKYIDPKVFIDLVNYLKPFIEKAKSSIYGGPSSFELFLAIALLYFKRLKCEWVVLEVGVGGRYDATNFIVKPLITVVTNIDYDHTEILGKTLVKIAHDKAGIIKSGSAFFTSEQRPVLQKIFKRYCQELKVPSVFIKKQKLYSDYNVELVRAIGLHLGIKEGYIERGIKNTRLPCRFELVQNSPLVVLDGAHNRAKIRSVISNLKQYNFKNLYLILAIADSKKDHRAILKPLLSLPYLLNITFTKIRAKSIHPNTYLTYAEQNKKKDDILSIVEDPDEALSGVLRLANKDDMILVTGSFFLAGELRKKWISEDWILKNKKSFKTK